MKNLQQYLTIKQAAAYLGVAPNTLRNWGANGKIKEHRNPLNGYRLFRQQDLDRLLKAITASGTSRRKPR